MNTPAHLLIGAAAFGKKGQRGVIWAALAGALVPDMSLYLLAGGAMYLFGISPDVVFRELYYSDSWQAIFAIDNSFFVWGAILALALWRHSAAGVAFAGAALLHLCLDFPLHHNDGRAHFWPISNWVFDSPFSYWNRNYGADWIGPIEAALTAAAAVRLWLVRPGWVLGIVAGLLLVAEFSVTSVWVFVFSR